jgi:hypothetical protein
VTSTVRLVCSFGPFVAFYEDDILSFLSRSLHFHWSQQRGETKNTPSRIKADSGTDRTGFDLNVGIAGALAGSTRWSCSGRA